MSLYFKALPPSQFEARGLMALYTILKLLASSSEDVNISCRSKPMRRYLMLICEQSRLLLQLPFLKHYNASTTVDAEN
eukprot:1158845-Pelagomonas_calceolata.AAC.1